MWAAASAIGDPNAAFDLLSARKRDLAQERRRLSKELKQEERKRARRMDKARGLSDDDLMSIVAMRVTAKAKAKAKPKAKAKAKGAAAPGA